MVGFLQLVMFVGYGYLSIKAVRKWRLNRYLSNLISFSLLCAPGADYVGAAGGCEGGVPGILSSQPSAAPTGG
jgi:hypothetical protein